MAKNAVVRKMFGTNDDDQLVGGDDNDIIAGLAGNDALDGGLGDNALFGGAGNDIINGSTGNDLLDGGAGNDHLFDTGGDNVFIGGAGDDQIDAYNFSGAPSTAAVDAGSGDDSVYLVDIYNALVAAGAGDDIVWASNGGGPVYIDGGPGMDILRSTGVLGLSSIFGGEDDDSVIIESNLSNIDAGSGNDRVVINMSEGNHTIKTGTGADVVMPTFVGAEIRITDFTTGSGGDVLDLSVLTATSLTNFNYPDNPFATGHMRVIQSGGDTLFQVNRDGMFSVEDYVTAVVLEGVQAETLTESNLGWDPAAAPLGGLNAFDAANNTNSFL